MNMTTRVKETFTRRMLQATLPLNWETVHPRDEGYCYLCLYPVKYRQLVASILGAYPYWQEVRTLGGYNPNGVYNVRRMADGCVHVTSDGAGYGIDHFNIRDNEVVGGLTYKRFNPFVWIVLCMMFTFPAVTEARMRYSHASVQAHLTQGHGDLDYHGFDRLHHFFVRTFVPSLKGVKLCTLDLEVQKAVLNLDWPTEAIVDYAEYMCGDLPDGWMEVAEMAIMVNDEKNTFGEYFDSGMKIAKADAKRAINFAGEVHGHAQNLAGRVATAGLNSVTETADVATDLVKDTHNVALNIVKGTGEGLLKTVKSTGDTLTSIISERQTAPGQMLTEIAETADKLASAVLQPQEVADWTIKAGGEIRSGVIDNLPPAKETTAAVVSSVTRVVGDAASATKKVYGQSTAAVSAMYDSGIGTAKAVREKSYTSEEVAEGLTGLFTSMVEYPVPVIKSWLTYMEETQWGDVYTDMSEKAVEAVDNGPWFSEKLGETAGAAIRGVAKGLSLNEVPDQVKKYRQAVLGEWTDTPLPTVPTSWSFIVGGPRTSMTDLSLLVAAAVMAVALALFVRKVDVT